MLKKKYVWKRLSEDGLLRNTEPMGSDCDICFNNFSEGFDSEYEAIDNVEKVLDKVYFIDELVLIEVYHTISM